MRAATLGLRSMRRVLAGLLPVAVVVVGAQVAAVSSSAAPLAVSPRIVCPVEPAVVPCCGPPILRPSVTPCCPVALAAPSPQPVCCPVPTGGSVPPCPPPPPALTTVTTPNPSTAGADVTIIATPGGSLAGPLGAAALWQELPGGPSFQEVATTTPDASGAYKFMSGPLETNRQWYVVAGGVQSNTVSQEVAAVVTIAAAARTAKAGRAMLFSGHVTPNHTGARVVLERLVGGGWRSIASAKINRASRYVVRAAFTGRGRVRVRTLLPADARNMRSASPALTLSIA